MSKKSFKDNAAHFDKYFTNADTIDGETLNVSNVSGTYDVSNVSNVSGTHDVSNNGANKSYYRLNLKLNAELKAYLTEVSWIDKTSITQYINRLIEADKAARGM